MYVLLVDATRSAPAACTCGSHEAYTSAVVDWFIAAITNGVNERRLTQELSGVLHSKYAVSDTSTEIFRNKYWIYLFIEDYIYYMLGIGWVE